MCRRFGCVTALRSSSFDFPEDVPGPHNQCQADVDLPVHLYPFESFSLPSAMMLICVDSSLARFHSTQLNCFFWTYAADCVLARLHMKTADLDKRMYVLSVVSVV